MSHSYPSDISRGNSPGADVGVGPPGPRHVDLYERRAVAAARGLPHWRTCYKYFRQWSERLARVRIPFWSKS